MRYFCQSPDCGKEFIPSHNAKGMYCSRSCAAVVNNQLHPKRKKSKKNSNTTCRCGGFKHAQSLRCHKCKKKDSYDLMMSRPVSYYICNHPEAKAKFNSIRKWARDAMDRYGPEKSCQVCGFDIVVEVCHIKGIAEFSEDALMSEVNALSNLIYLCPNHHAMLDKNLIQVVSDKGMIHILTTKLP